MADTPYDTPTVQYGYQDDYRRLFKSNPDYAITIDIFLQRGFGLVKAGTTLAKNISGSGSKDFYVPYNPTTFPASQDEGRAYMVADGVPGESLVYVSMRDSYKFKVGDDVIINDNVTGVENLGAVTVIDRTTENHRARITFTTAMGATAFTAIRKAHVFVEAGVGSNNYSDCAGVLMKSVNTGDGERGAGAGAQLILSNALLYRHSLTNMDAAALDDIAGAAVHGQFLLLK